MASKKNLSLSALETKIRYFGRWYRWRVVTRSLLIGWGRKFLTFHRFGLFWYFLRLWPKYLTDSAEIWQGASQMLCPPVTKISDRSNQYFRSYWTKSSSTTLATSWHFILIFLFAQNVVSLRLKFHADRTSFSAWAGPIHNSWLAKNLEKIE